MNSLEFQQTLHPKSRVKHQLQILFQFTFFDTITSNVQQYLEQTPETNVA